MGVEIRSLSFKIVVLVYLIQFVAGYSITQNYDGLEEESTTLGNLNEYTRSLGEEITTETAFSDGVVVTEDQFLADSEQATSAPVTTLEVNDEENELFRDKRDIPVTENVPSGEPSPNNDEADTPTVPPPVINFEQVNNNQDGDDFLDFKRPTTPDPNAEYEEEAAAPSLEDLREVYEAEGVNITGEFVRGRASCRCGTPAHKIVGGEIASIKDYPWTVGLTRGGRPYCGGSLINNYYVATASHCVDGQTASRISVVVGEQDYNSASDGARPVRIAVSQIIMHERYNNKNIDNDIALLRLAKPVQLGGTNIPVCLPASNQNDFTGETATVAGWGATSQGGSTSSNLRRVMVPILSNTVCNGGKSRYSGKITQNMMCAGLFETGGKDSCQGDSGGPLIIENGGRRTLVGIVSWGYGCAQAYAPGVYTRVGRYPEWILSKTRGADWCQG
ncbi:unnamed protein product [Orchesella dallaii]|uniref:Peptidase S1 domain-containing protein n=1 Tax=Orchesella dallaii TaxID=48710 RepID=A0ABP1R4L9_9HEXA